MIGIYCIKNQKNGKRYVGQSGNIMSRWNQHIKDLQNGSHNNRELQYDFNEVGIENFTFSVLEEMEDKINILERENYFINQLRTFTEYNKSFVECKDKDIFNTCIPTELIYNSNTSIRREISEDNVPYIGLEITLWLLNEYRINKNQHVSISIPDIARFRHVNPKGSSPYRTIYQQLEALQRIKVNNICLIKEVIYKNNGDVESVYLSDIVNDIQWMTYNNNELMSLINNTSKHIYLILTHKKLITNTKNIRLSKLELMKSLNVSEQYIFDFNKKMKTALEELLNKKIIKNYSAEKDEVKIRI